MQLGEGAHGVVYLAKMQDTYVAVKVRQLTLCSALYLQTDETAGWAPWLLVATTHPATYCQPQVFAVQPGLDSHTFWHEISLLSRCVHPMIVPVYGVAVHVRMCLVLRSCVHALLRQPPGILLGCRLPVPAVPATCNSC